MPDKLLPWVLLFDALLLEVAAITSMKLSRGFSEPLPPIAVPIFYMCSAGAVILALKWLGHLVGRQYGARGVHWHRLFPRVPDAVQIGPSNACDPRGGWLVAGRAAD
jgi:hypothetical protein